MKNIFKLTTAIVLTPTLFTFIFPSSVKANNNSFDVCLRDLTASGIPVEQAQTGCADALVPTELSTCVKNISTNTNISSIEALKSCYQVRRPLDLGSCVVNINRDILMANNKSNAPKTTSTATENPEGETPVVEPTASVSPIQMALNTCQASLLPLRHSECVIGLSRTPQPANPTKAMETCLSAENFPRDLFPSYQ
ncbi:hypothetical protein ACN4EE_18245 [Geminocystis sp. CENA526]|uniref:hypothetical protein n=1 Tax=Geminocystis sp. CENA526 TaxID=1355871 RepID=UPI003D6F6A54